MTTNYKFVLYKHGPYSFDLRDDLVNMTAAGLLIVESRLPFGPSIDITQRADRLMQFFPQTIKKYAKEMDFVVKALSGENVISLERLATALYVTKESGLSTGMQSRAQELNRLKPHVSLEDPRQAVERIDQLVKEARQAGIDMNLKS